MSISNNKIHLRHEHKVFVKDLTSVIISYTPLSGFVDTIKFSHKWFGKKKLAHRVNNYITASNRKNYIKSRNRRVRRAVKKPEIGVV